MSLRSDVAANGFGALRDLEEPDIIGIASTFGTLVAEPRDGILVKSLRPVDRRNAPMNTLSSRYGTGPFPLHTEAAYWPEPPHFLMLYCVSAFSGRQDTVMLDGYPLNSVSGAIALRSEPWIVAARRRSFLCTVIDA